MSVKYHPSVCGWQKNGIIVRGVSFVLIMATNYSNVTQFDRPTCRQIMK